MEEIEGVVKGNERGEEIGVSDIAVVSIGIVAVVSGVWVFYVKEMGEI